MVSRSRNDRVTVSDVPAGQASVVRGPGEPPPAGAGRRFVGFALALGCLASLFLLSLAIGSKDIPLSVVVEALQNDTGEGDATWCGT